MKIIFTIFCITFFTLLTLAQKDNGYYGKKGFLQVQSLVNTPLFSNIFLDGTRYVQSGNKLIGKKDHFNVGYRITAGYSIKRNFSLLFEFGQDFSSVYFNDYASYYSNNTYYSFKHEAIDLNTTVFMPIIEFGSANALLPMGLSHQIGFGIATTKVKEKDYMFQIFDNNYYPAVNGPYERYSTSSNDPLDFNKINPIKKYVLMYGLSMRSPITKSLMINYGVKYTLNIKSSNFFFSSGDIEDDLERIISRHRALSFINVNIGLVFAF